MFTESMRKLAHVVGLVAISLAAGSAHAGLAIQSWTSAHGTRVLFVENHDLPMLDVQANFRAGTGFDPAGQTGVAGMTHALMRLGAGGLSEQAIAEALADVGAQLGQSLDADRAAFSLRTLSAERERTAALDVLQKVLSQPALAPDILQREKTRAIAGLQEAETQPEFLADRAFSAAVFGVHPYGASETVASLEKLQAPQLAAFHRAHYSAANLILVLMGDIARPEAERIAAALSAALPQGPKVADLPAVPARTQATLEVIPHHATQSHIRIGLPGMTRDDADYFPLLVGNYILGGGGFDSRLMHEIRDGRGLAYSVYSYFLPMQQRGAFEIGLQTRRDATDTAVQVVRETLQQFLRAGPTEAELEQAKANLVNSFPLRLDSNRKIVEYVGMMGFYGLPLDWLERYPRAVAAVDRVAILRAFQARVEPLQLATVIVGGQPNTRP